MRITIITEKDNARDTMVYPVVRPSITLAYLHVVAYKWTRVALNPFQFLQKFDCSAHQDRAQDGSDPSMPQHIVVFAMVAQELDHSIPDKPAYIQR